MPEEVTNTPNPKNYNTQERESIPWRQGRPPSISFDEISHERKHQEECYSQETGVEDRMPGSKEGVYDRKVIVCPPIYVHTAQKPATEENHDPIKASTTNSWFEDWHWFHLVFLQICGHLSVSRRRFKRAIDMS